MDWQQLIVTLIGIGIGVLILWRIICACRYHRTNPCGHCGKNCPLRTDHKEKESTQ
ncbi:MAG: hypothetical protein RR330_06460 [Alistipes sp.]